jgi:hypothetical protein
MATERMWWSLETFFARECFLHMPFRYCPKSRRFSKGSLKDHLFFFVYFGVDRVFYFFLLIYLYSIYKYLRHLGESEPLSILTHYQLQIKMFLFIFGTLYSVTAYTVTVRLESFIFFHNGIFEINDAMNKGSPYTTNLLNLKIIRLTLYRSLHGETEKESL